MSLGNPSNSHIFGLPKNMAIAVLVMLSCYYLWVLYLAATPKVTPAYKTYYINTDTLYWGKDNHELAIDKQQVIDVTTKTPFISREGWDRVAKDNQRGLSNNAGLYFSLGQSQITKLKLQLTLTKPPHKPLPIVAKLDDQSAAQLIWLDSHTLQAEFDLSNDKRSDTIHHIQFTLADTLSVSKISLMPVESASSSVYVFNQG